MLGKDELKIQAKQLFMSDNTKLVQDHPLKTVEVVFTRICFICISKYLKKGHNSVIKIYE